MKRVFFIIIICLSVFITSCTSYTRGIQYPKFYEEKPVSIMVMPPINNTTNVEAKELLYTSISYPLIEAGYYVVSPHLSMEILKAESAYDAEVFINNDISVFRQVFGVDAVIFSVIDMWEKKGLGIETKIKYIVKSTKTNNILFERTCDLYLNLQQNSGSNSVYSQVADLAVSIITTMVTDHIVAARKCNNYIFSDIPRGKYSPDYMRDKEFQASEKNIKKTVR